tara:strand:- start:1049 stop:1273 length:225 start_codon:yes stop_codon:yes gene_type:complete
MENQHRKIKGYRELTQEEIELMNRIKEQGECLASMIDDLVTTPSVDLRWAEIAKMNLQQGIMAAVRSVARPESF